MLRRRYVSALAVTAALALSACSGSAQESAAQEETTAAETEDYTDIYAAIEEDQELIDLVTPHMPDDIGKVLTLSYKGLSFEVSEQETVDDTTVTEYMETNIFPYVTDTLTEGTVQEGDTAVIDYVGTLDGEAFDGGSYEGYELVIGSGTFIEGFEEGLIGAGIGETRQLELTFPEDYGSTELAGKETVFTVTVQSIERPITMDEFDDEMASDLSNGEYQTKEEYLGELKKYLELNAVTSYYNSLYNTAIATATEESEVEPTDEAIEWQLDVAVSNYSLTTEDYGLELAYYLYYMGTDYSSFRELMRDSAAEGAKEVLVVFAICDEEGLEADDEAIARYCDIYGYTPETITEYLDDENLEIAIKWYLAGQCIVDNGSVTFAGVQ